MDPAPVTVAAVEDVGSEAFVVRLETPEGFSARPGQFVKVVATVDGETESRFYTISSPDVEGTFELTIEVDPEGEVSPQLRALGPGDEVTLGGPYGSNYYEDEDRVLVVAGGPGVGPAVGIAERVLREGGEAAVVYRDDDPIHEDRLADLADRGAVVRVLAPGEDMGGPVAEALEAGTQVFVYGFADFLDDAMAAIEAAGGEPDAAKVENFG